jgi:PST family polysaccharide transporter
MRGAAASLVGQTVKVVLHFVGTIALTRLLTPEDFGLVAMVTVFVALSELIRDFGMSTSGIQSEQLSLQQASNLFWVNLSLGILGGTLLIFCGPLIAIFYDEPRLEAAIPCMAAATVLNGAQAQLQVQLIRAMRFGAVIFSDCAAWTVGYAASIIGALYGMGYWALVIQPLVVACAMLGVRWTQTRFIPLRPKHLKSSVALFRAGGHYGLSYLLHFAASNADTVAIGARFGSVQVGYYNRAFQLLLAPQAALLAPMTNVVIPTLRKASLEGRDRQALLVRLQSLVGYPVAWVFVAIAFIAEPITELLFGSNWGATGVILRILALGGILWTFNTVNYWAFITSGKSEGLLICNIITKAITITSLITFSFVSQQAVAWAFSLSTGIAWLVALVIGQSRKVLSAQRFYDGGVKVIIPACLTYAASWLIQPISDRMSPWSAIIFGIIFATILFLVITISWRKSRKALLMTLHDIRTAASVMLRKT